MNHACCRSHPCRRRGCAAALTRLAAGSRRRNVIYGMYSGTALLLESTIHRPQRAGIVGCRQWMSTEPDMRRKGGRTQNNQSSGCASPRLAIPCSCPITARRRVPLPGAHRRRAAGGQIRSASRRNYRVDPQARRRWCLVWWPLDRAHGNFGRARVTEDLDPVNRESARVQALVLRAVPTDLTIVPGGAARAPWVLGSSSDCDHTQRFHYVEALAEASPDAALILMIRSASEIHGDADGE